MNDRRHSAVVAAIISTICHGFALQQFRGGLGALPVPPHYPAQFLSLLSCSFACSCIAAIRHSVGTGRGLLSGLLSLQWVILIIIGLPLGDNLLIESSLLTALLFAVVSFVDYPVTIPFSSGCALVVLALQRPISAWNVRLPSARGLDLLSFLLYACALVLALNWLARYRARYESQARLAEQRENAILQLTSANIGFQNYATSVEEVSMRKERNRITREIHDAVGSALTNVMMMMESASDLAGEEQTKLRSLLRKARHEAQGALDETRRALRELRAVETQKDHGLAAVHKLVKAFQRATNVQVTVEYGDVPWSLGEEADLAVYRMIQEGLTNAFKHGKATKVRLLFWRSEGMVWISITDDGHGTKDFQEGIGISGMRERIEQLGGRFEGHRETDGFALRACIPCVGAGNR